MASLSEDLGRLEIGISDSLDPAKSIVLCTRILKLLPGCHDSYSNWALQLLKQGQCQKAKRKFKRSIQISPNRCKFYGNWRDGLYFAREFEEVILLVEKYLDKFTIPENALNTAGMCYLHLGDYENAIKCFQNSIQGEKSFGLAYFNWALALHLQGKEEEVGEMYARAWKLRSFPEGAYKREVKMLKEDLKREENEIFQDLIKAKIEGFEYFIEMNRGKKDIMVSHLEDLSQLEDDFVLSSNSKESLVFCTRMLKLYPNKPGSYLKWALQLLKQKKYQKAKQKFKKAIQISPNNVDLYDDWAVGLYFAREFEEVMLFVEKYPDKLEYPHLTQNTLGICYLHFGDYENAIKYFQKAILVKDNDEIGYFNWALALYLQGKKEEALEMYEKAEKIKKLPVGIYSREVNMLKEDLKKEENKMFEDLIKKKLEGFEYFLELDRMKREGIRR